MSTERDETVISEAEVTSQLPFFERALMADDDDARRAALIDGIVSFGDRFVVMLRLAAAHAPQPAVVEDLATQGARLHLGWLKGQRLTTRADEPERRARAALRLLAPAWALDDLAHYAAQAILDLPDGHPLRDAERARAVLRAQVVRFHGMGDAVPWALAATCLALAYEHDVLPTGDRDTWDAWAEAVAAHLAPEDAVSLWMAMERHYLFACTPTP